MPRDLPSPDSATSEPMVLVSRMSSKTSSILSANSLAMVSTPERRWTLRLWRRFAACFSNRGMSPGMRQPLGSRYWLT